MVLHELLARLAKLRLQAKTLVTDTTAYFKKDGGNKFEGMKDELRNFHPVEGESTDFTVTNSKELSTTVLEQLKELKPIFSEYLDCELTKDETNASQLPRADLQIGEDTFNLSACALLTLKTNLNLIRPFILAMPTRDANKAWKLSTEKDGAWVSEFEMRPRQEEVEEPIVLYQATPEHPAQTQLRKIKRDTGQYRKQYLSGAITTLQKTHCLARLDSIIAEVEAALSRANGAEVCKKISIGQKILTSVFSPIEIDIEMNKFFKDLRG